MCTARSVLARSQFQLTDAVLPPGALTYSMLRRDDLGWEQADPAQPRQLQGCRLHESEVFVDSAGVPTSPMWAETDVGEFYCARSDDISDLRVYDERKDKFVDFPNSNDAFLHSETTATEINEQFEEWKAAPSPSAYYYMDKDLEYNI